MNKLFNVKDIVSIRNSFRVEYFIVIDVIDMTLEEDENPYYEYEIMKVFPVLSDIILEYVQESYLKIVATPQDKEHQTILGFIKKEREKKGWFDEPYLNLIGKTVYKEESLPKKTEQKPKLAPKEKSIKFGDKEIKKILNDTKSEKQLDAYLKKMDTHLKLLHKAIEKNDTESINLQKEKLTEIRNKLMELEYFQLEKRIEGLSIKIK